MDPRPSGTRAASPSHGDGDPTDTDRPRTNAQGREPRENGAVAVAALSARGHLVAEAAGQPIARPTANSHARSIPIRRYPIPARTHRVEQEIQRSRFITTLAHAPTAEAARAEIAAVREEFPDATHHCWAYVAGPPGETAAIGLSDDGEPHGTAGRPMLTTLLHSGTGEVVAVVTRYYGGTKLGTGGLVRAYTSSVQQALESLPQRERVDRASLDVEIDYAHVDGVQRILEDFEAEIDAEEYSAAVRYRLVLPEERVSGFREALMDVTHGQAQVETVDEADEEA